METELRYGPTTLDSLHFIRRRGARSFCFCIWGYFHLFSYSFDLVLLGFVYLFVFFLFYIIISAIKQ